MTGPTSVLVVGPAGSGRSHRLAVEVDRAAAEGGDVVVADDAESLDDTTLDALVARVEAGDAVAIVQQAPGPPGRPALGRLAGAIARRGRVVELGPADDDTVAVVAATHLGRAVPTDAVPVLRHLTGGNLALVAALAAGWSTDGVPDDLDLGDALPASTRFAVADRWSGCSADAGAVLDLLTVAGAVPDADVATCLRLDRARLAAAQAELTGRGLVDHRGVVHPVVALARRAELPSARRNQILERTAEVQHDRGVAPATLAPLLRDAGAVGPAAAAAFVAAGDATVFADPAVAEQWYDDAVLAGAADADVAAGRAEARWYGARPGAWDALDSSGVMGHRAQARLDRCAAALAAGDARLARAGDLLARLVTHLADDDPQLTATVASAVVAMAGTGRIAEARDLVAAAVGSGGTGADLHDRALLLHAELALAALGAATDVVPRAMEVAELAERVRPRSPTVDSAPALAALSCLLRHDHLAADAILDRAVAIGAGGPVHDLRHRLLLAWIRLRSGRYDTALELVAELPDPTVLGGRDRLVRVAVDALLARRSGDVPGQLAAWRQAELLLARQGVDLWSLDVWGELVVAAARVGAGDRSGPVLAELRRQVALAGDPEVLAVALDWVDVQAAAVADTPERLDELARRLATRATTAEPAPGVGALAAAARAWADVLSGRADREAVDAAAQGLVDLGYPWEASRLLGQAAIRSTDAGATRALLERARDLKAPTGHEAAPAGDRGGLSEREVEVSGYLLDGLTHKEIGAQLYISAKTVEHHVARIRTKLGASSRAELLAELRGLLGR